MNNYGFVPVGGKWVDAYAVNMISDGHKASTCELWLSCGKVVYSGISATEAMQLVATARAECEGRS